MLISRLHLLSRCSLKNFKPTTLVLSRFSSSDAETGDNEKKNEEKKRSQEALDKLKNLLQTMVQEDRANNESKRLELAKPKDKRRKGEPKPKIRSQEEVIASAVKEVAQTFGGDVKQTESELISKLLSTKETSNLDDVVKGLKVEKDGELSKTRAQQVKGTLERGRRLTNKFKFDRKQLGVVEKVDLFGAEPLNIFTTEDSSQYSEGVENKTWNKLHERELKLAVTHPPSNYFQQMILWTEQGKVWKFPIDNEQGLEKEQQIYFAEHVFLEKHLEPWCPRSGPLRHFMELVCVGLSKNPYLTVEAKKEHIDWYKNYFEEKKQLLQEVGAFGDETSSKPKQIEK